MVQVKTLLELHYGTVSGHIKKLPKGAKFHIKTPLGTVAVLGNRWQVSANYNAVREEFILTVKNIDGKVNIISRFKGSLDYGRDYIADKHYESSMRKSRVESIPPKHTVNIRMSIHDPHKIIDLENYPPSQGGIQPPEIIPPVLTPEDPGVVVISPDE